MAKIYRVLRVLEYVGTREFIDQMIERRSVKGTFQVSGRGGNNLNYIREAIVGDTAEIVDEIYAEAKYGKVQE